MTREDREAIIRRLEAMYGEAEDKDNETKEALFYAIEALKEQRPHGEWIPCSERLPEHGGFFLITNIDELVRVDFFRKSTNDFDNYSAIAWMPLPEQYKRGEAE